MLVMIIVYLMGGLGNQMFQYAAARRLALVHNTNVGLDLRWYERPQENGHPRPFELGQFAIPEPVIIDPTNFRGRIVRFRYWAAKQLRQRGMRFPGVYFEPHHRFNPNILRLPNHTFLVGHFESECNFADVADQIWAEFQPRDRALVRGVKEAIASIRRPGRSLVSVHVRRGDLGLIANGALLIPRDKTLSAMNWFADSDFLVCSDDMEWCRANIKGEAVIYSPFQTTIEDLFAVSLCDHHVLSNSTFSWWGAWLNRNPGKIAVAPLDDFRTGQRALGDSSWLGSRVETFSTIFSNAGRKYPLVD
jgi:hypothetical protein